MVARVLLKKGCIVPEHSHHNEQLTYILDGALKFWIDGKEIVVHAGEVLCIPAHMPHKAEALEDTVEPTNICGARNSSPLHAALRHFCSRLWSNRLSRVLPHGHFQVPLHRLRFHQLHCASGLPLLAVWPFARDYRPFLEAPQP